MYKVRVFRRDDTAKSGRTQVNKQTNGGTTLVSALALVAAAVGALSEDQQVQVVRVLIESESTEAVTNLALSFNDGATENGTPVFAPVNAGTAPKPQPAPSKGKGK